MTYAFVGLMALYRLTAEDAGKTNARREDARQNIDKMRAERPGFQAHVGNFVSEGDSVAMIITEARPSTVNGQAFLDGNDSLWVTSVEEGEEPGQWLPVTDG